MPSASFPPPLATAWRSSSCCFSVMTSYWRKEEASVSSGSLDFQLEYLRMACSMGVWRDILRGIFFFFNFFFFFFDEQRSLLESESHFAQKSSYDADFFGFFFFFGCQRKHTLKKKEGEK